MKEIKNGIVFSYDIKRILNGVNAFDYQYDVIVSKIDIDSVRKDFELDVSKIFNNKVSIVSEDDMMRVNDLIDGWYPHCYFR